MAVRGTGTGHRADAPQEFIHGRHEYRPQGRASRSSRYSALAYNLMLLGIIGLVALDGGWNTFTIIGTACLVAAWLLTLPAAIQRARKPAPASPVVLAESLVTDVRRLKRQGDTVAAIKVVRERTGLGLSDAARVVDRAV